MRWMPACCDAVLVSFMPPAPRQVSRLCYVLVTVVFVSVCFTYGTVLYLTVPYRNSTVQLDFFRGVIPSF